LLLVLSYQRRQRLGREVEDDQFWPMVKPVRRCGGVFAAAAAGFFELQRRQRFGGRFH